MSRCVTLDEYNNATGLNLTKTGLWNNPKSWLAIYESSSEERMLEISKFLEDMGYKVKTHWVSLLNYKNVLDEIVASSNQGECKPVIMNLAWGEDLYDGCLGLTFIKALEKTGLPYTGGDSKFYSTGNSKFISKPLFQQYGVPTAPFVVLHNDSMEEDIKQAEELFGYPMIVKADKSYSSLLLNDKSLVYNTQSLKTRALSIWDAAMGHVLVEKFVAGREFTVHVAQLFDEESGEFVYHVYDALEREFVDSKSGTRDKQFFHWHDIFESFVEKHPEVNNPTKISSCHLEEIYGNNASNDSFEFKMAPAESQTVLKEIALNAFKTVSGQSYGRADIRAEMPSSIANASWKEVNFYVLEMNAHPDITPLTDSPFGVLAKFIDGRQKGPSVVQFLEGIIHTAIHLNKASFNKPSLKEL